MVSDSLTCERPKSQEYGIIEKPLKWCSVSLSDIMSKGKRLEASVFDVEAKQAYDLLTHGKYPAVNLVGHDGPVDNAYYGGRLKRNYVDKNEKDAVGFLGSSEMLDCRPEAVKYMIDDDKAADVRVKKGLVLISRSGTIGNVTYVGETLSHFLISEHAIRLECKNDSGYVYTFLKSKIGKLVVCSTQYGAVIREIEPEHLATVPIPNAPIEIKSKINDLIVQSFELRDESNKLIDNATSMLIEELHLPDMNKFDVDLYKQEAAVDTFSIQLSDMAGRLDASYHVPIVDAIIKHLEQYAEEITTLGDKRLTKHIVLAGVFKRTYVDEEYGYPFLGGKEITQLCPKTEKFLSKTLHKSRYEKELRIKENTILVTDRGSIGIVALVPKHWNDYAVSQNVLKVIPTNDSVAGYLYIYLNSDIGKNLVRRHTYGSVVDMIDNNSLAKVHVPLLKNQIVQEKINNLALEANHLRYEAYCLEQEALRLMNDEVIYAK